MQKAPLPGSVVRCSRSFYTCSARYFDPCPTIASVRGVALGGGFELALACDMIVAEEGSSFGLPEIWLGCLPPIAAAILPRLVTPQKEYELVLIGEPITATEAKALGLANPLTPRGTLEAALRLGEERRAGEALKEIERIYGEELMKTEDVREGIRAHLEKREAKWKDR